MAALDRAFPLEQVHDVAVRVAEDLDLHVARLLDVTLEEHRAVAERGRGLALRAVDRVARSAGSSTMRIPRPPPPERRLHQEREPDLAGGLRAARRPDRPVATVAPGSTGTPAAAMRSLASIFDPIRSITAGGGPTNTIPASAHARAKAAFSERKP